MLINRILKLFPIIFLFTISSCTYLNNVWDLWTQEDIEDEIIVEIPETLAEKRIRERREKYLSDKRIVDEIYGRLEPENMNFCADEQLDFARNLQDRSKKYLKEYYRNRINSYLFYSWYALEDSNFVLDTVQRCSDKSNKHYYAVQNLKTQNEKLSKYIALNGRSREYLEFGELYLDEYYNIFPRDIR